MSVRVHPRARARRSPQVMRAANHKNAIREPRTHVSLVATYLADLTRIKNGIDPSLESQLPKGVRDPNPGRQSRPGICLRPPRLIADDMILYLAVPLVF